MTEPSTSRPVPGPARPVPGDPAAPASTAGTAAEERFAGLADRPVAEHAEVFEAEHDRLQTELGTIDRV
jgi:hypothetical protein